MPTYIGIGFSSDPDTVKATQAATEQAKSRLHASNIDIAIVFNTSHYHPADFIPILYTQLKKTRIIGSSTAGILLDENVEKRGIAILLMYSDEVRFETSAVENLHLQDLTAAGAQLSKDCVSEYGKEHRKLFLFFADGLIQEVSKLISGINSNLKGEFPVIGAGSSDNFEFKKTYQYFNNTIMTFGACGVLFGGRLLVGSSCRHGWRPLGKPRLINEAEGNLIKTIAQKPAAHIYEEFFGDTPETLKASSLTHLNARYPIGTSLGQDREYLIRNVLKTLEDDSIVLQDGFSDRRSIHLMIGNKESCLQAAEQAAIEVKARLHGRKPKLIFIFESLARYRVLGRAVSTESHRIREILGSDVPIFGMYSFGEIFTHLSATGREILFQNESIIITALC